MTKPTLAPAAGVTVHIGCGYAMDWRDSANTLQIPEGGLVLVEPNPVCAEELRHLVGGRKGVRVVEAVICNQEGDVPFQILSVEDLSGLHGTEQLAHLMPGLRVKERIMVPAMTVAGLLAALDLHGEENRLIIEAIGEESHILSDLTDGPGIELFAEIAVQVARELAPEMKPGADFDATTLSTFLAERGFCTTGTLDNGDPDFPRLGFRRDALLGAKQEIAALREQLATAQKAVHAAEDRAQAEEALRIEGLAETRQMIAGLQTALTETGVARDELAAQVPVIESDRSAAKASFEIEIRHADAAEAELTGVRREIEGLRNHILVLERERNAAQAHAERENENSSKLKQALETKAAQEVALAVQVTTLEADAQTLRTICDQQLAQIAQLEGNVNETKARAQRAEASLELLRAEALALEVRAARTQQDLGLALRLQSLASADLKELQTRYGEVLKHKEDQDELIAQLVVRLGDASEYLRTLALSSPEEPDHPKIGTTKGSKSASGSRSKALRRSVTAQPAPEIKPTPGAGHGSETTQAAARTVKDRSSGKSTAKPTLPKETAARKTKRSRSRKSAK